MSFDSKSLERLRDLGRKLPEKLPEPEPIQRRSTVKNEPKLHRVETEQDPEALFHELMTVSQDGTVPDHLMARLKDIETKRTSKTKPGLRSEGSSTDAVTAPQSIRERGGNAGKTTRPTRRSVSPGSEEERLYVAFGQLLLEDDEVID